MKHVNEDNLLLNIDSYKASHLEQYPENVKYVSAYIESRGGEFDKTLFFGLQGFINQYLSKPITMEDVKEAEAVLITHGLPFSARQKKLWEDIVTKHKGMLPIDIRAVPEGTVLGTKNVLVQIRNTDPDYFWLPSYIETMLLRAVWYPTTVATISYHAKQTILKYLEDTCDKPEEQIAFRLHDFGARGVSSKESAAIGGAAHMVNFMGSDTVGGILWIFNNYSASSNPLYNEMPAFSIPAAEHGTITSWTRSHEKEAYANMIDKFGGEGKLVAVVSDSYDIFNAVSQIWGRDLKSKVIDNGCTLVIRPDSGKPSEIVPDILKRLDATFGSTINSKGYKVLHPSVRVIQGDGVNLQSLPEICQAIKDAGFSIENVAFGMGGGLLQHCNRDTLRFAQKISAASTDGRNWFDVYKDPITDKGKMSKRGIQKLIFNKQYQTVRKDDEKYAGNMDVLEPVYQNGQICRRQTFDEIRQLSNKR